MTMSNSEILLISFPITERFDFYKLHHEWISHGGSNFVIGISPPSQDNKISIKVYREFSDFLKEKGFDFDESPL